MLLLTFIFNASLVLNSLFTMIMMACAIEEYVLLAIATLLLIYFAAYYMFFFTKTSRQDIVKSETGKLESLTVFLIAVFTSWISPCTVWRNKSWFILLSNLINSLTQIFYFTAIYCYKYYFRLAEAANRIQFLISHVAVPLFCFSVISSIALYKLSSYYTMYKCFKYVGWFDPKLAINLLNNFDLNREFLEAEIRNIQIDNSTHVQHSTFTKRREEVLKLMLEHEMIEIINDIFHNRRTGKEIYNEKYFKKAVGEVINGKSAEELINFILQYCEAHKNQNLNEFQATVDNIVAEISRVVEEMNIEKTKIRPGVNFSNIL